ncbi:MAG: hypothetical protein KC493_15865 [Bacteriovoracaceae bacterium]|nr:hypothetical protein [Bacteriovoracaceae bacterium]
MKYLILFFIVSCASTKFVAPDLEVIHTRDGKSIGGVVVYNHNGIKQLVVQRKGQAIKRMRHACSPGAYRIVKETIQKPSDRDPKYKGNMEIFSGRKVKFIDYECVH